ncbi:MAG: CoA ester lyase [Clostridia bacterium]|nr:CoA ester lyase [Clostridia bacterium]
MIRSMLFLPGNSPKMLEKGPFLRADALVFDLEDAVAPDQKDAARTLLKYTLAATDFGKAKKVIRINSIDSNGFWKQDLEAVIPAKPFAILLPKVERPDEIQLVASQMTQLEELNGMEPQSVRLIILLETCLGIERAYELASSDSRIWAIQLGAEDLTADMQAKRTNQGDEIMYARMRVINAACAAKIEVYDSPFTDMSDTEGFEADLCLAKRFGFSGKTAINPRHVASINRCFLPTQEDIDYAHAVLNAIAEAKAAGRGAIALRGKMIDRPVVLRAQSVIAAEQEFKEEMKNG